MDIRLEGLCEVVNISDDIVVFRGNEKEHDKNLRNLMKWSAKRKISFNFEKCEVKKPVITFFSNQ